MIGVNQFAKLGVSSMEEIYEQATQYYIAGKEPQARHLIIAAMPFISAVLQVNCKRQGNYVTERVTPW